MSIRAVVQTGCESLLKRSTEVLAEDFGSPDIMTLVEDMFDTMKVTKGIGIAAPQIGVNYRIIILGGKSERYADQPEIPVTKLINPGFRVLDDALEEDWEGCLSVKGVRGLVPRYKTIVYGGFDIDAGREILREATGFHARVVQHECDHLDGILFTARVKDPQNLRFENPQPEPSREGVNTLTCFSPIDLKNQ